MATVPIRLRISGQSVNFLDRVEEEAADALVVDSLEDLVQGRLLGPEGLIPDRRSTCAINDLQNNSSLSAW